MQKQLKTYQIEAVKQLLERKKAFLTLGAGLGKTITSLSVAKKLKLPTLVICKKSNMLDWLHEGENIGYTSAAVVNYAQAYKIDQYSHLKKRIKVLIIDECQHIGSWNTRKGKAIIRLAKQAEYVYFLSATLIRANAESLYWPLKICGEYTGSLLEFRIKFCGAYLFRGHYINARHTTNIKHLLKHVENSSVNTSKNVRKVTVIKNFIDIDRGIKKYIKKPTNKDATKFVPVLNTPCFEQTSLDRKAKGLEKLEVFRSYIKHNSLAKKAVFFTHHITVTQQMTEILNCKNIIGGQSTTERMKLITEFNNKEEGYLVISMSTGSEGVNIQNCDTCYFIELSFSPATYLQACYRFARDSNDKTIYAYFFRITNEHTALISEIKKDHEVFYS